MDYKGLKYIPPEGYISNTYVVQKGDSLYSIARKLNTTVDELKRLNNLTSNTLSIGQVLTIPTTIISEEVPEPNYFNYKVVSGDSLYKIAKKYNVSRSTITMINIGQNCQKEGIEYPIRKITDNCNNIKCKMYDINSNQLLKEFVSFREASSFLEVKRADSNIRYALKKDGIAYGYKWEVEN